MRPLFSCHDQTIITTNFATYFAYYNANSFVANFT